MPTYDYVCRQCGHSFELFQSMSASIKRKCPECGERKLERLIGTGAGIIFKGSGFYETDYRSDSYKKAAEADTNHKSNKSESKSKSDKSTDSKTTSAESPSKKNNATKPTNTKKVKPDKA